MRRTLNSQCVCPSILGELEFYLNETSLQFKHRLYHPVSSGTYTGTYLPDPTLPNTMSTQRVLVETSSCPPPEIVCQDVNVPQNSQWKKEWEGKSWLWWENRVWDRTVNRLHMGWMGPCDWLAEVDWTESDWRVSLTPDHQRNMLRFKKNLLI